MNIQIPARFTCPICGCEVRRSAHLHDVFKSDPWAEWAANLVTHYRHNEIKYYDRSWRSWVYASKNPEYKGHDSFKIVVNNRAKRQLIKAVLKAFDREVSDKLIHGFAKLQYNDENTIELIKASVMDAGTIVWAVPEPERSLSAETGAMGEMGETVIQQPEPGISRSRTTTLFDFTSETTKGEMK